MFDKIRKMMAAGTREIKAEYGENRIFLEAVCAAVALVANADGNIEESERRKALSIVSNHSTLSKIYRGEEAEKTLDVMFRLSKDASGRQQLARDLDQIKSRADGAQMAEDVYLIATDIAAADGNVGEDEKVVLQKIAKRLGIDESRFDF